MTSVIQSGKDSVAAEARRRIALLFSIDYRSLAAFRIMAALTIIYVCIILAPNLDDFFFDGGILSTALLNEYLPNHRFTILEYVSSPALVWALWTVLLASATCLLFGYRSRLAAAVCFLTYSSLMGRNPLITQGGDNLICLLLFWAIFLPTGRAFGVDGALERGRNLALDPRILSVATVGLLLQALYVYFFGALLKTGEYWIPNGQAVYVALHADAFVTAAGHILRDYIVLTAVLTYFVFYLELLAPLLLFFPDRRMRVRGVSLAALMLMHVGFRTFLNIGHFWLVSLSSLMPYIPSRFWGGLAAGYWKPEQRNIRIHYDKDCGFCLKTCLLLREFFLPHDVFIGPAQDDPEIGEILRRENSWVVVAPDGRRLLHWDALTFVVRQSPVMRPVWLVVAAIGAIGLGRALYDLIGRNRLSLGPVTAALLPFNAGPGRPHAVTRAALAVVIALCLAWNIDEHYRSTADRSAWSEALLPVFGKAGFSQRWTMFAPNPGVVDGYPVVSVRLDSSEALYLGWDGSLSETLAHPERLEQHFPSYRWRKYFVRIGRYEGEKRAALFGDFARWRCAELQSDGNALPDGATAIVIQWASNTSFLQDENEYSLEEIGAWPCPKTAGRESEPGEGDRDGLLQSSAEKTRSRG